MSLKLIVIYAAYGDALLLQTPDQPPKYWLIDGGPIYPGPAPADRRTNDQIPQLPYYQYLKRALYRYCSSLKNGVRVIDKLAGIIVTHPDGDHMDGINRLLRNDLLIPDNFKGPVVLNSTFYRRRGKPPFKYHLTKFLDAFSNKGQFGIAKVLDPFLHDDLDIPTNMKNGSIARLYKMVHGAARIPYPLERINYEPEQYDDPSTQNWSSIITMWLDQVQGGKDKLSLVTTGDGLSWYIVNRIEMATPTIGTVKPDVGIFKVPHHGSEYNNQLADDAEDAIYSRDADQEKKFFFCLTMLALQYHQLDVNNPPQPRNAGKIHRFKIAILQGSPMLDWTVENEAKADKFEDSMQKVSEEFRKYLKDKKTAQVGQQTFDLQNELELRNFTDELVARYDDRKSQIVKTGRIADRTPGASEVTIPFDKKKYEEWFQREIGDKSASSKYFKSLFRCLDNNTLLELRKAKLIQNFYSRFTADNYVISGNRIPHGHPKPSVMAGLISHLILTRQATSDPPRIFVTDGASIILDYVFDLIETLLSDYNSANPTNLLTPDKWRERVRLYCLATDFLAEIPFDISDLEASGVKEINFSGYAADIPDQEEYLTFLHNQFLKSKPYDMPRAAISQTSKFYITIRSNRDRDERYLDIGVDANSGQPYLRLAQQQSQPLFDVWSINHTTNMGRWATQFKTEPHFELSIDQAPNQRILDLVFFPKTNKPSPADSDSYVYRDSAVGLERLHLLSSGDISFKKPADGAGHGTLATVRFRRKL